MKTFIAHSLPKLRTTTKPLEDYERKTSHGEERAFSDRVLSAANKKVCGLCGLENTKKLNVIHVQSVNCEKKSESVTKRVQ